MSLGYATFSYSRIAIWKALIRLRVRNDTGLDRDAERLQELGCEYAQGFLFSEPLPARAALATLRAITACPRTA